MTGRRKPSRLQPISDDVAAVLQGTVDEAARLLRADGAMIYLYDRDANVLRFARDAGIRSRQARRLIRDLSLPVGTGMFGTAFERAELVATKDYELDETFAHSPVADEIVTSTGIRAMAAAPMVIEGSSLGALGVFRLHPTSFDDAQLGLLRALANHVAVTIANERLQADLRAHAGNLAREIEEQRRLVLELGESERRYRSLTERSPDVVFEIDADGRFTFTSDSITRVAGWLPAELVGQSFVEIIAPESRPVVMRGWEALVADPATERRIDFELLRRGGESVPAGASAIGVTVDGRFAGIHGSIRDISERVRLEEELRQKVEELERTEERYRFLVERSPDIVYELDAEGNFTFISSGSQDLTGWNPEEVVGRSLLSIVSPSSLDHVRREWEAASLSPMEERRFDFELLRFDGGAIPIEARGVAILRNGRFAGVHGSVRDISRRVQLENDLRHRSEQLARRVEVQRTVSEIATQLTTIRDPAVVLQRLLNEAARLLDADCAEFDLITDDGTGLRQAYGYVREGSVNTVDSTELMKPDEGIAGRALAEGRVVMTGDYLTDPTFKHTPQADARARESGIHAVLAAPLIGDKGSLGAILMEAHRTDAWDADDADVLGTMASQAAVAVANARLYHQLETSERRYRHLVENSPDTVWSARANGTLTYFSETIERLSGWRAEELIGQHFRILAHPDSGSRVDEEWQAMVDSNSPGLMIRFHLRHRDGHAVPAETTGIAEIVDGRVVGAHGAVRDISARERLEVELREQAAELAASQERANLARELHDSITQALFSMGLTLRSLELLMEADSAAARSKLVELRELQKDALAEMRTLIFELRPKGLEQDGLERALRTHAASVQGRTGLSVTVEADAGVSERLPAAVEEALFRIAQEALHNVVKHASASSAGVLLVRAGSEIRLSVTDDGVGFDPALTPRGQHLGLVGMRQRAEQIGALFGATSRPGRGTDITVTWRLPDGEQTGESDGTDRVVGPVGGPLGA